jgi:hypothetical protein
MNRSVRFDFWIIGFDLRFLRSSAANPVIFAHGPADLLSSILGMNAVHFLTHPGIGALLLKTKEKPPNHRLVTRQWKAFLSLVLGPLPDAVLEPPHCLHFFDPLVLADCIFLLIAKTEKAPRALKLVAPM